MKFSAVNLPRVLRKFESFSGTNAWVSPLVDFEYESTQDLLTPVSGVIGTDFGFDLLGEAEAPLDFGEERLRFSIVAKCSPTEIDENPLILEPVPKNPSKYNF